MHTIDAATVYSTTAGNVSLDMHPDLVFFFDG